MISFKLSNGKDIRMPETALDWQLYSSKKCGWAVKSLNAAAKRAVEMIEKRFKEERDVSSGYLYKIDQDIFQPLRKKYADVGASDTEPRGVCYGLLERTAHALTGNNYQID